MSEESDKPRFARRDVIAGAGALIGIAAASGTAAEAQGAGIPARSSTAGGGRASPVASTIASPPLSGRVYRHVSQFDFSCEAPTAQRAFGGYGVLSVNIASALHASMEIPVGARIRDIEWYVYNNSGSPIDALGRLWGAGEGSLANTVADCVIPSSGMTATRVEAGTAGYGPYPTGTKLALALATPTNGTVQINGVRVGFTDGVGQVNVRTSLFAAYDSRTTGGKFAAGETRTITLPAAIVPSGTTGVLANIQALNGAGNGFLRVYSSTATPPGSLRSLYYTTNPVVQMLTVPVPINRKINIYASQPVHIVLDIAGTVG